MKKICTLCAALLVTLSLAACASGPNAAEQVIGTEGTVAKEDLTPSSDADKEAIGYQLEAPEAGEEICVLKTNYGDIKLRFFPDAAPKAVYNFKSLALSGYYDGLTFHRVIPGFMIQGGCPLGTGTGGPGYDFDDEIVPTLTFDHPYLLAMANAGLRRGMDGKIHGTNGSQFFITTVPTPWLNGHHTIFGEVADDESKAVVDKLEALPTDRSDRPMEPAGIISVEVVK